MSTDETTTPTSPPPRDESSGGGTPPQRRLHPKAEDCRSSLLASTASVVLKKHNGDEYSATEFSDLPVGVVLKIASYLDAKSLCHLQATNRQLHSLMSDELLWRRKLWEDSRSWDVVGNLSHPRVYQEASSDLTAQEIYSSCYTNRAAVPTQQSFSFPLTQKLRSFVRRLQGHVPRLLVFGSGLESVPLVKRMILDSNSPYKPTGLFPGKDGAGSGMCIKHKDTSVNLVTLYTATKAERKAATAGQAGRVNKLISTATTEEGAGGPVLTPAIQEQCQLADGLILSVDATNLDKEVLESDMTTLRAMLLSCNNQRIPLLVLSCLYRSSTAAASTDESALPSLDVADRLKLLDISNPWQVRALNVETFDGLAAGLDWILTAAANN